MFASLDDPIGNPADNVFFKKRFVMQLVIAVGINDEFDFFVSLLFREPRGHFRIDAPVGIALQQEQRDREPSSART